MKTLKEQVLENPEKFDFSIENLGKCTIDSPLEQYQFIGDSEKVSFLSDVDRLKKLIKSKGEVPAFQKAGPRNRIFHDPSWTRVGIVTCGGLCPGLNDVIRGIVMVMYYGYDVRNIFGIRYGFRGLNAKLGLSPIILDPALVDTIHVNGGTILGSSRGHQNVSDMVDSLQRLNINILFCIGGDGTLKGAAKIAEEVKKRKQKISIVGIPKTIDNDLNFIDRSFGFESAVYAASDTITCAHNEANGAYNGIGLVKLMGRDSGFIAAYVSIANPVVNFCLIPEVPFTLDGEHGLLQAIENRMDANKNHTVIVVAEGAGQDLFKDLPVIKDDSGNVIKYDIGIYLKNTIKEHFQQLGKDLSVKYFDPSYSIRSVAAEGTDAIFCLSLAENAVHAAMAGKTNMIIGYWNSFFTHVPIKLATIERKKVNTKGSLWKTVLMTTGQNDYFYNKN
jgi:6-phosphofructokinase 1